MLSQQLTQHTDLPQISGVPNDTTHGTNTANFENSHKYHKYNYATNPWILAIASYE